MAFPKDFPFDFDVEDNTLLDIMEWLRSYLLTRQEIVSFVGSGDDAKIYVGQMPTDESYSTLIVLSDIGGTVDRDVPIRKPSIQFRIYGDSMANARELYKNLFTILHGKMFTATDGEKIIALEEVTGQLIQDRDLNKSWWYMLTSYEFIIRHNILDRKVG